MEYEFWVDGVAVRGPGGVSGDVGIKIVPIITNIPL